MIRSSVVSGIVCGKAALADGDAEAAARHFALAVVQASVLAFPPGPRRQRVAELVDHQRRRLVRRPPAGRLQAERGRSG